VKHKEQQMTKDRIMELFLEDMKQPAIQLALHSSFRKYATRRDQLIDIYSTKTGIPADEFHTAIAMENFKDLA
jgi:hypothetical protein